MDIKGGEIMKKKNKTIIARVDEQTENIINQLKKAIENEIHQEVTNSDVIRYCIHGFYKQATEGKNENN